MVVELFVGKDLSRILCEKCQKIKFKCCEGGCRAVAAHFPQIQIDFERSEPQYAAGFHAVPPSDAQPQPQLQLNERVRLGKVVLA